MGALLGGMEAGKAANKARRDAEAKAKQQLFENNMKIATESRLLTGAAEDEFARIEAIIDSPSWDPSQTVEVMRRAERLDKTYPDYVRTAGSATAHFKSVLHLGAENAVSVQDEGKQGPPSPGRQSSLAGWRDPQQKRKYEETQTTAETKLRLGKAQDDAWEWVKRKAVDEMGMLDPNIANLALLEYQTEFEKQSGMDKKLTTEMFNNLWDKMGKILTVQAQAKGMSPEELKKEFNKMSVDLSSWIRSELFTGQDDVLTPGAPIFPESKEPMRHLLEDMGQKMILAGMDLPTIKGLLVQAYVGPDGKWQDGSDASPYAVSIAKAPPEFILAAQRAYNNGADPARLMPYYHPESKTGWLVDNQTGELVVPLYGAPVAGFNLEGPTPAEQELLNQGARGSAAPIKQGSASPAAPTKTSTAPNRAPYYDKEEWDKFVKILGWVPPKLGGGGAPRTDLANAARDIRKTQK